MVIESQWQLVGWLFFYLLTPFIIFLRTIMVIGLEGDKSHRGFSIISLLLGILSMYLNTGYPKGYVLNLVLYLIASGVLIYLNERELPQIKQRERQQLEQIWRKRAQTDKRQSEEEKKKNEIIWKWVNKEAKQDPKDKTDET